MQARAGSGNEQVVQINQPDIISALSFALDLTEGAVPGHAVRSTVLGMRIGLALGLPAHNLEPLYYALQLKDVGCSSNAARMAQLFGDDEQHAKATMKLTDWTGLMKAGSGVNLHTRIVDFAAGLRAIPRNGKLLWGAVLPGAGPLQKLQRIQQLGVQAEENLEQMTTLRCDRGASILRKLQMNTSACDSVRHLDERWDGSGYPGKLVGEAIPVFARIAAVAQSLDVFATAWGVEESIRTLRRRSGTWFDPSLVKTTLSLHKAGLLWSDCEPGCPVETTRATAVGTATETTRTLDADRIDSICEAFAEVVDAKSPFTFRHSLGVTATTEALCEMLGFPPERKTLMKRAALLHDLGKLAVPNAILDKPSRLSTQERAVMAAHPAMSRTILSRIEGFQDLAEIAGQHHEKLDGSGYPDGLSAAQLSLESRLLTVADCFTALAEDRPYREAIPLPKVIGILRNESPDKLDGSLLDVLEAIVSQRGNVFPAALFQAQGSGYCCLPA